MEPRSSHRQTDLSSADRYASAAVEWLTRPLRPEYFSIKDDLTKKVQASVEMILFGAVCTIFSCAAYGFLSDPLIGLSFAIFTVCVAASRALGIKYGVGGGLAPVFIAGLAWAATVGVVGGACTYSGHEILILLGALTSTGLAFGCAFSNAGAPRFASLQVLLIAVPFVVGVVASEVPHAWLILPLIPVWAGGIFLLISHAHEVSAKLVMAERENQFLAYHDALTGLSNRASIMHALKSAACQGRCDGHIAAYLLYLDLDGFKHVNDSHGHQIGDGLLRAVAGRLRHAVRPSDQIGRIGGDEFLIILRDVLPDQVVAVAQRLVDTVSVPFILSPSVEIQIGVSVGGARLNSSDDIERALEAADTELYSAKTSGKGRTSFAELLNVEPLNGAVVNSRAK